MLSNIGNGYLIFHAIFTLPVIAILVYLQSDLGDRRNKRRWQNLLILIAIAYVYTTPWDNLMIAFDTWWYGDAAVWQTIWHAPVGEYLFFGIQTIIMGLYLYWIDFDPRPTQFDMRLDIRVTGTVFFLMVFAVSSYFLIFGSKSVFYGSSIIAWTAPVIALQWAVGGSYLLRKWKEITLVLIPPTLYLWTIDAYAISMGLWTISSDLTVGLKLGPMPIEEMLFFFVANVMTVFGMVLYEWVLEVWRSGDGVFLSNEDGSVCRLYYIFEDNH